MPIFDIFKKNKGKVEKKPLKKKEEKSSEKKSVEKRIEQEEEKVPAKKKTGKGSERKSVLEQKRISRTAYRVLGPAHVTEKATILTENGQYVFKVSSNSNKKEIKRVVEELYGVDVVSVRVITIKGRKRRLGKIKGWTKGYRKAIVRIKKGQKIEILPR